MRIAVVGNIAGGKTVLSRELSRLHKLPLVHVDSIQFQAGMKIRPLDQTRQALATITAQEDWIIDGYGPLDLLEHRFQLADRIIFVDLPFAQHVFWLLKRQFWSLWRQREELANGCNEATLEHTRQLYRRLRVMHTKMRPELLKLLSKEAFKGKLVWIQNKTAWNQVYKRGALSDNDAFQ